VPHTIDGAAHLDRSRQVTFEGGVILRAPIGSIDVLIEQRLSGTTFDGTGLGRQVG
jgi:hypothetical protein